MESTDSTMSEFPLDELPLLVIELLSSYLSSRDLAACCAVSRGVREVFNNELVWKPRYDEERGKYLLNTPCKVHPIFETPDIPDSSLSPLSESRKAFMAENHLWNNWIKGNYKKEKLFTLPKYDHHIFEMLHVYRFLSDDLVMSVLPSNSGGMFEILDVRETPASRAFKPIPVSIPSLVENYNDLIYILYNDSVQVYFLNDSTNEWTLKHSFFFEDSQILPDDRNMNAERDFFSLRCDFTLVARVDSYVVAVKDDESTFHIWNFETGVKINEAVCPIKYSTVRDILGSSSKDLILCVVQKENGESPFLLAYSLASQTFLPFKETAKLLEPPYRLEMFGNYVAVWDECKFIVYDYLQSQIILKNQSIEKPPQAFGSSIVFLEGKHLKLFNPSTLSMHTLQYDYGIANFKVICSRFIQVERHYYKGKDCRYEMLEISSPFNCVRKRSYDFMKEVYNNSCSKYSLNKSYTRVIQDVHILHFW